MKTLICLGDSLTFGLRVPRSQSWPRLVAEKAGVDVVNLGISGDTTSGMLARLQTLLQNADRHLSPECMPLVLVMGGSNDIFYAGTDAGARANLGAMVHQLKQAHMVPVVGIPVPVAAEDAPAQWGQLADFGEAARMLEDYSRWLHSFCRAFGIACVDFRQDFLDPQGGVRRELFADGLHPNARGHEVMAQRLMDSGVLKC